MAASKFLQPAEGIVITSKVTGPPMRLDDLIEIGKERIAAGESLESVAQDIAEWDAATGDQS